MLKTILLVMTAALGCAFVLSLFARHHWFADLFSHFLLQYMIGGILLCIALALIGQNLPALLCILIAALSLYQLEPRWPAASPQDSAVQITVVQYNRLRINKDYGATAEWLRENAARFDVVVLQEITQDAIDALQNLNDLYPHRFPQEKIAGCDVYILSRHPFTTTEIIETGTAENPGKRGAHVIIHPPAFAQPVSLYTIHAKVPLGPRLFRQRNEEIFTMGKAVRANDTSHKILMGDWNITPYSPHFKTLLTTAGLTDDRNGLTPLATWPSFTFIPALQIPIDHILVTSSLNVLRRTTGPALSSDHYPVIATISEK